MNWQAWVVVAVHASAVLVTISTVGKQRPPITPGVAAISTAVQAALIGLVVWAVVS